MGGLVQPSCTPITTAFNTSDDNNLEFDVNRRSWTITKVWFAGCVPVCQKVVGVKSGPPSPITPLKGARVSQLAGAPTTRSCLPRLRLTVCLCVLLTVILRTLVSNQILFPSFLAAPPKSESRA